MSSQERPPEPPERGAKRARLRDSGTLNPHPERVTDPLFVDTEFFDPDDVVQVKYEMLRRVEVDRSTVRQAAEAFGFSRPVYYQARDAFTEEGLAGLVPAKRGPKGGHKLTPEVLDYIDELTAKEPLPRAEVARRVAQRFDIQVHPRSIDRARARKKNATAAPDAGRHRPTGRRPVRSSAAFCTQDRRPAVARGEPVAALRPRRVGLHVLWVRCRSRAHRTVGGPPCDASGRGGGVPAVAGTRHRAAPSGRDPGQHGATPAKRRQP